MNDKSLNLFDFGINDNGDYVNLVEEEKIKNDLDEKQFKEWINSHENPLIRIASDHFLGYRWDGHNKKDIIARLEKTVSTKCYHYGNMEKGLYIFSLYDEEYEKHLIVFENEKHYLAFCCNDFFMIETPSGKAIPDCVLEDYLTGKQTFKFPACYCPCYDLNGNRIEQYAGHDNYQDDIRYIVCIKEWHMDKFSENRMKKGKKIVDFYEVEFTLQDLIKYWGENDE